MTTPDLLHISSTPAEICARIHAARLQMTLLTHRARTAAIAAVQAGWWQHTHAHAALTSAGLPGLPMIWPIHADVLVDYRVRADDAEQALDDSRPALMNLLGEQVQDIGCATRLTMRAVVPTGTGDDDGAGFYTVTVNAALDLHIEAGSEQDATDRARRLVTTLLSGYDELTLTGGEHYRLPEDTSVGDLEAGDLPASIGDIITPPTYDISTDPDVLHRLTGLVEHTSRALRTAVIDDIGDGIGVRIGEDGYHYADQILQTMGLAPLPRSWQYEITARLPVLVDAPTAAEAIRASVTAVADIDATQPQRLLPVTATGKPAPCEQPQPVATGQFRIVRTMAYLVCLRGAPSQALAEAAVRAQLSTFDPDNADLTLTTVALGSRVDRLLHRDND